MGSCKRVLMVGSAEESAGGVSSVIRLIKKMPVWEKYQCFWLGTQIQRNYLWKLWYAVKGNVLAFFIIWRFDIIHLHTTPDRLGLVIQLPILLMAKLWRKKVILHLHVGNQLANHTDNKLFVWCLNHADRIVLLAKKWETLFKQRYSFVSVPTSVIYNASEIVPEVDATQKEKLIMMAAYYCDNKAPDILLEAWKQIHQDYPDWKVALLGNGEVERYKQMAQDLGIEDTVSFPGYVVGRERESYFQKASIYCMCSYEEGFPMVVLESWMYGICVVTTPVGGLPDVMEEGRNCLAFDFGDVEGLAKQLKTLIENNEMRLEMSRYSRPFVIGHFSMEKISEDIDFFYSEI